MLISYICKYDLKIYIYRTKIQKMFKFGLFRSYLTIVNKTFGNLLELKFRSSQSSVVSNTLPKGLFTLVKQLQNKPNLHQLHVYIYIDLID